LPQAVLFYIIGLTLRQSKMGFTVYER